MLAALWASPALAQFEANARRDLGSALRILRPLVREDPERALQILQSLDQEYPGNSQILLLMGELYQTVGEMDSARAVYERCLAAHPTSTRAGAALGMLYVHMDERRKAERVFKDLLNKTSHSAGTYRVIGSTLSNNGYFDMALRIYEDGRRANEGNYILTIDIAYLNKLMGNFEASLREYITLIETAPRQHQLARTKIMDLLDDPQADTEKLLELLRVEVELDKPNRTQIRHILALAYLESGMLEDALEMAMRSDSRKSSGIVLFNLAEKTMEAYRWQPAAEKQQFFDLALRATEVFLERHSNSPQVPRVKLMLIDLLVDVSEGQVQGPEGMPLDMAMIRAMDALDWLIDEFPGTEYAEKAWLKKGDTVWHVKNKPREALEIYALGMKRARLYPTQFAERLGRVYLALEEYSAAEKYFTRLTLSGSRELQEAGFYYTGMMLSFMGQYEEARDTLTTLAERNPGSMFTNNSIELAWVIEEGLQGEQRILKSYIGALKAEVARDTAGTVEALLYIVKQPGATPLRLRALIRLGDTYASMREYARAIDTYEQVMVDYRTDILVADVERKIGQVYEQRENGILLALEKYENILLTYPHYIFLDEVRADVARLREELGVE